MALETSDKSHFYSALLCIQIEWLIVVQTQKCQLLSGHNITAYSSELCVCAIDVQLPPFVTVTHNSNCVVLSVVHFDDIENEL